jgi:hypothetical protein
MNLVSTASPSISPGTLLTIILGILGFSAFLAWIMWSAFRQVEREERDPRYLRRRLVRWAYFYSAAALIAIVLVVTGKEPKEALIGLPMAALLIWTFWRSARSAKVSPE